MIHANLDPTTVEERFVWKAPCPNASGVGVVLINYRTPSLTRRCLESLTKLDPAPAQILVLDNAPEEAGSILSPELLECFQHTSVRLFVSSVNLGFAAGCNFAIEVLLADECCRAILLLNNDAVGLPPLLSELLGALTASPEVGMVGGRLHDLMDPQAIDTLGITLHASLMPANRLDLQDPFLGPTGGCCLLDRAFIQDMQDSFGYVLDPRFFCYCEDTDLVVRALLKGYRPAYVDRLVALHQGQGSTGKGYNPFIAYHGLRNVIWMHAKWFSSRLLLRHLHWLLLAHTLAIVRHLLAGHPEVVYRVYRDAWRGLPACIAERRTHRRLVQQGAPRLSERMSKRFYQPGYFKVVLSQLAALYRR
ncbi:glycosyltransferase [Thermochromatium tepidum]|uniref:Glycosyltransferase n=1 Tax=Thermochromatium tepidum ATCC 43061 TaxID=316276 RepID=A0A6I6E6S1_THETI|nr:glycosyltransferase [Thermochromatium tepidum]QGU33552.1 glycosyltransferase [Thermochromatium tepidum ATCC 43061]